MILSPSKTGYIDPVWYDVFKHVKTEIPIVIVTRMENFEFNEELCKLGKWIMVDGCEYNWNAEFEYSHFFGFNENSFHDFSQFPQFNDNKDEWVKFNEWVKSNQPIIYFKRELLEIDADEYYRPINYPCWHPIPEPQTKEDFDKRILQANFIWGLSHEYRKTLHGKIWQRAGEFNYIVCDNLSHLALFRQHESNPNKWLTVNTPWYARQEMSTIIAINSATKISISIGGAGRHCFRDSESPINSVMYRWEDDIAFSYQWVNGINCIKSKQGSEIETIIEALNNPNLYDIYRNGVENCRKYYLPDYVKNYIEPLINNAINQSL